MAPAPMRMGKPGKGRLQGALVGEARAFLLAKTGRRLREG